jgi:hypothetical protein
VRVGFVIASPLKRDGARPGLSRPIKPTTAPEYHGDVRGLGVLGVAAVGHDWSGHVGGRDTIAPSPHPIVDRLHDASEHGVLPFGNHKVELDPLRPDHGISGPRHVVSVPIDKSDVVAVIVILC